MGVEEDVDVIASDGSAAVLRRVDHAVNHHLGTIGNHPRVHGNGVTGSGHRAGVGVASPALGTGPAWTIARCLEYAQGNQVLGLGSRGFLPGIGIAVGVGPGVGEITVSHIAFYQIDAIGQGAPVHVEGKGVTAIALAAAIKLVAVFPGCHSLRENFLTCILIFNGYPYIKRIIRCTAVVSPTADGGAVHCFEPSLWRCCKGCDGSGRKQADGKDGSGQYVS